MHDVLGRSAANEEGEDQGWEAETDWRWKRRAEKKERKKQKLVTAGDSLEESAIETGRESWKYFQYIQL